MSHSALYFLIALSLLTALPLLFWYRWFSARQVRIAYLCRWILIPYLGLISGVLSPRLMGLTDIEWLVGFQWGMGLAFAILVTLLLVRTSIDLDASSLEHGPERVDGLPEEQLSSAVAGWITTMRIVVTAGAEEFHWAFLRAAMQAILLPSGDALSAMYTAIWIAALLAAPEALLRVHSTSERFAQIVTLIVTSVLFLFTRNFWLCWALHAAIQLLWRFEVRTHAPMSTGDETH